LLRDCILVRIDQDREDAVVTNCDSCGFFEANKTVEGVTGKFCSMKCVETELFGGNHCRWCGKKMDNPYTSIDSRLCSHDCSENYYTWVLGDKSAALGKGKRYRSWLLAKQVQKREFERDKKRRKRASCPPENGNVGQST
jgi:hypothetical protein